MKKFCALISFLLILANLASCSLMPSTKDERVFSYDSLTDGTFSITLNDDFREQNLLASLGGCLALYDSSEAKVMVMMRDAEDYEPGINMVDYILNGCGSASMGYAKTMVYLLGIPYEPVEDEETGLVWYRYDASLLGVDYAGICYVFQFEDALWVVDMACSSDNFDEMLPYFEAWALSVTIK